MLEFLYVTHKRKPREVSELGRGRTARRCRTHAGVLPAAQRRLRHRLLPSPGTLSVLTLPRGMALLPGASPLTSSSGEASAQHHVPSVLSSFGTMLSTFLMLVIPSSTLAETLDLSQRFQARALSAAGLHNALPNQSFPGSSRFQFGGVLISTFSSIVQ